MRVFDLVGSLAGQEAGVRLAVIGSCRVHDPFETLANCGRAVRVWANPHSAIHTFGEARQIISYTLGQCDIPRNLFPYIFYQPTTVPPRTEADKRILESVDAVIIEVSELRQVRYESHYFQINFFYREFVSKYGAPLLPWYRSFSLEEPVDDKLVETAMDKLVDRSAEERAHIELLLRHTRLEGSTLEKAAAFMGDIVFDRGKKWLLVSHFAVPGLGGTQMKDRHELIDLVRKAADQTKIAMFDPTTLLERHGREVLLANGGRDIYHYETKSYELVADELLTCVGYKDASAAVPGVAPAQVVASATEVINGMLVHVHRERLQKLGEDASGLYAHYRSKLDVNDVAGPAVTELAKLVFHLLPPFDYYHVLRAGLGELAFVLAALGLRTTAFDAHANRFGAITAGFIYICGEMPEIACRMAIGRTAIPDVPPGARTLGIASHFIGYTPDRQEEVLDELSSYSALLIDPRVFMFVRKSAEERDAVVEAIRRRGYRIRSFPFLGVMFCARPECAVPPSARVVAPKIPSPIIARATAATNGAASKVSA